MSLFEAFISGAARDWFGHQYFGDPEDRRRAVLRAVRPLEARVSEAIARQNACFAPSSARDAHLAQLARGAAAVVTGQQVGLFLGPLYTLYKAATAVRLARTLSGETGQPVVPIFWLQTEDHDLPEVATTYVPTALGAPRAISVPASIEDRRSLSEARLPAEVEAGLASLSAELGNLPHAAAHIGALARHYRAGASFSAAFSQVLAELFAPEGLVLVDPRDAALARAGAEVHRRAIERRTPIALALASRARALEAAGLSAPVHVRPGAPLSFFHPEGPSGPRYRLEPRGDGLGLVGREDVRSEASLLAALDEEPLCFTTSALLRPILQDRLLPTAAYVGGPGEIAYFAQLAPLYAELEVPFPIVAPRARFFVLEAKTARLLDRLGLERREAELPENALLARVRSSADPSLPDASALEHRLLEPFRAELASLRPALEGVGPGLDKAVEKTRSSVELAVAKLLEKYENARLHADEARVADVRRLKTILYPNGAPQERVFGLACFAARFGARPFLERVLSALDPLDPREQELSFE